MFKPDNRGGVHITDPNTGRKSHRTYPRLPDGSVPEIFKKYPCRLLLPIEDGEGGRWEAGDESFHIQMTPAGEWYIMKGHTCYLSGAQPSTHFDFL